MSPASAGLFILELSNAPAESSSSSFLKLQLLKRMVSADLDNGCVRSAQALADSKQAVASAAAAQFVDQRGHQLGAGSAKRVTERLGAAIDVQLREISADRLGPCQLC